MAIRLEKSGDQHRINLEKKDSTSSKEIIINLNWSQGENKGLFSSLFSKSTPIDLDLGCYYELVDGTKMVIDGLQFSHGRGGNRNQQSRQGCYTNKPFIWHKGDDRGNSTDSGEYIYVNPEGINTIHKMIVYCFIYEGVARWAETNAVVTIKIPGNQDVIIEMGKQTSDKLFSAIAELSFSGDNSITIKKLITFHDNHSCCDKTYNWGFTWGAGSKD